MSYVMASLLKYIKRKLYGRSENKWMLPEPDSYSCPSLRLQRCFGDRLWLAAVPDPKHRAGLQVWGRHPNWSINFKYTCYVCFRCG